jgi:hypothetical protein
MRTERKLLHFLDADTREPLCDGEGVTPSRHVVNGVGVCVTCARRITDAISPPGERTTGEGDAVCGHELPRRVASVMR